ncbi:MAG TPA: hypothetical protein DDY98_02530 [Ruminococcaceae bacterium]|nr:hypothetical protein [Oscillospiraceae bacterium]
MNEAKEGKIREGDKIENEWSKVAYDSWCRELDKGFSIVSGVKAVDLYAVVRSVIEKDLSDCEREVVLKHYYDQIPVHEIAQQSDTRISNVYNTLSRAQKKIERVLRHLVFFEDYRFEKQE